MDDKCRRTNFLQAVRCTKNLLAGQNLKMSKELDIAGGGSFYQHNINRITTVVHALRTLGS